MKLSIAILSLFAIAVAQITCPANQEYAKFTKHSLTNAAQESFVIQDGSTVLYTSPTLVNNEDRVLEVCLPTTASNQYSIILKDSSSNSWTNGCWVSIESINGNLVFKQMMSATATETYQFSLYSPIKKNSIWKYTANASGDWTSVSYPDAGWTDVTTGTTTQTASGVQYFRHAFAGSLNQAAIDLQMNYRFGVVAYINGVEIFRDNMLEGVPTASTPCAGFYSTVSYHGLIRPSNVAEGASSVLAVEMHPSSLTETDTITFNGFINFLAGISASDNCFVIPYDPTVTYSGFTSATYAFTWTRSSRAYSSSAEPTITADYSTYPSTPMISGVRMWPYTSPSGGVTVFKVEGAQSTSGTFNTIMENDGGITYVSSEWVKVTRITPAEKYKLYRFTAYTAQSSTTKGLYELQYVVCNEPIPTVIPFEQDRTSFYRNYEPIDVKPAKYGFSNCQISPQPPAGLTWDTTACSLTGISTELLTQQTYTVTATIGTVTATGTFSLSFIDCAESFYKIVRTYKTSPQNEYFRIYDSATNTIIFEVQQNHNARASVDWEHYLCFSNERFDVTFYHTGSYWVSNSYFYLYNILPNNELDMMIKGRYDSNDGTATNYYVRRPHVNHSQQWKYKFDSVPANWYTADVFNSWSQNTRGNFGTATNKIQLFAKTFNVNNLSEVKGYILSIRYKYGCVVYLNGHEAFRNGVTGDIGPSAIADNLYNDVLYHVVTLPGKTITTSTQPTAINYLQQGTNTIAIALVAIADTQTTVDFDCIVRLMPSEQPESHIWDFTGTYSGMSGGIAYPFNMYYANSMYYSSTSACTTNYIQITLDDDRREWVSSVVMQSYYTSTTSYDYPAQFKFYARNGSSSWILLKEVTGLTYSMPGQKRTIYIPNNTPYNQFRFENIFPANHTSQCKWRIQSIELNADNTLVEVEPLTYPSSVEIFKDIEMSEVIPSGDGYGDFSIEPDLPAGIHLDSQTGWITGTATAGSPATTYTITANKFTGGTVTATISIAVDICANTRSLMTVRFRADSYTSENSWKLYQRRGTTGTVLDSVASFPVASAYYYVDFCLENGIYTLEGQDTYGDGWSTNTGYTLTADVGKMELEIQEMYSGTKPVKVSSVFSTYFPFQVEYTDWKVNQSGFVEGWTGIAFDDSTWSTMKAAEIPTTEQITTYIRKTFTLTNVADYQVLNIRMKYAGGVACYLNGNLAARLNLQEEFDDLTESLTVHDATVDGKFHIVLPTAGVVEGTNVIAFEIHRPVGASSIEPVVFDATGVFGVDDCNVVIDSFAVLENTATTSGTIGGIMDLDPYTTGTLPNTIGTYIEWTVDNLMGSKWNTFNIHCAGSRSSWGFDITAVMHPDEAEPEVVTAYQGTSLTVNGRTRPNLQVPVALAGFRKYRWEITDASASNYALNAFFQNYCKATGEVCPAIDNYPSVGEGQISPSTCPEGYKGYSYRECAGGQLGEVKMDKCSMS